MILNFARNSDPASNYFVEFEIASEERFQQLDVVVTALREAKHNQFFHSERYWLSFFDAEAMSYFWHPIQVEFTEWEQHWFSTSVNQRFSEPNLETLWDFGSMIGAFEDGDYDLLGCKRLSGKIARLEFHPHSYPYGGTGSMKALIGAFGHRVVGSSKE